MPRRVPIEKCPTEQPSIDDLKNYDKITVTQYNYGDLTKEYLKKPVLWVNPYTNTVACGDVDKITSISFDGKKMDWESKRLMEDSFRFRMGHDIYVTKKKKGGCRKRTKRYGRKVSKRRRKKTLRHRRAGSQ
jgi:hypothetical protein